MKALGLIVLLLAPLAGCAGFAAKSELRYGKSWTRFAAQAGSASLAAPAAPSSSGLFAPDPDTERQFERAPEAQRAVRRVQQVLASKKASPKQVREAMDDIAQAEGFVGRLAGQDPELAAALRMRLADLRRHAEAKLLEVLTIEPAFNIAKRGEVRIAVVRIGEGVETIRRAEMLMWRQFLAEAGFSKEPVFIGSPFAGSAPTAADLRVAAARLGADAVLAYTTSAATTIGPMHESVAVLSFAKCMLVDTRSEYLYLNAEGEDRTRRVGVPFTITQRSVELESIGGSVVALHTEITRELKRLVESTAPERR